ncbi:galactose-1-epimerase [Erwinia tracheiphila]|uniref:Aldose 1-epimerase n=1 Tax=Erwinia tracheiphila TaxID=65700 RepID=A0A345CPC0_9GAMM|nr:galactose-1-epimerase [Erwinia tracheiphila]AXF75287.1 galactose-1-epimerase [Erwinia tracheiphila]UIA82168.1 galactose-1-epimerase [Erwinia tracheiphila]UIA90765.1 galactose-1-epimerase [Erwinia tracheiphila]
MLTQQTSLAPDGQPLRITTLRNAGGMVTTFMDWGATWLSARVPMKDGTVREALLGCSTPSDYLQQSAYLGATIGRYANRIARANLHANGQTWQLEANQGIHQLHGGSGGFHQRRWQIVRQAEQEVEYRLNSADGEQGFPGNLQVTLRYRLGDDNTLSISFQAAVDRPCPINLTNHAYFNLDAEQGDARQHRLQLHAERYLPVDSEGIPYGPFKAVEGTSFDFRQPKTVAQDFLQDDDQRAVKGYDHAFLLCKGSAIRPAAELWSADGKLRLRVHTSAPALQFYSGNFLQGTPAREQGVYAAFHGIALESGFLPDSPNHPEWPQPDCWLKPGESYQQLSHYCLTPFD